MVAPPALLGRVSLGPGGPDTIAVGAGLVLSGGTLSAELFDTASLPAQTNPSSSDQLLVINSGSLASLPLDQMRELFAAGSNITIDANGTISASATEGDGTYNISSLTTVTSLAAPDLVAVSQGGQDHTIAYSNLIDGVTIDQAGTAAAASDTDMLWVAQSNNILLRQTLGTIWSWITEKLPLWRQPVIELTTNTTLEGTVHNNAILICSSPVSISAQSTNLGSGFSCEVLNVSSGSVAITGTVIMSGGATALSPNQWGRICCVSYSGGAVIFASLGTATVAISPPGQTGGLASTSVGSNSVALSWSAPISGGAASSYSIQDRVSGTTVWGSAGQTSGATSYAVAGLASGTSYDFTVSAVNSAGPGPSSAVLTVTTLAENVLPGAPTSVIISDISTNGVTCSWTPPAVGGTQLVYAVQYSLSGQNNWASAATTLSTTTYNVTGLSASTSYDFQITASNAAGSGPASVLVTAQTTSTSGMVTSITWNLGPVGSFTHGVGAIGLNVHVTPGSAQVQFGFSGSSTVPPTSWVGAVLVNSNLWGAYVPTPATAGNWYAWAEGVDGSAPTVYPTSFAVG